MSLLHLNLGRRCCWQVAWLECVQLQRFGRWGRGSFAYKLWMSSSTLIQITQQTQGHWGEPGHLEKIWKLSLNTAHAKARVCELGSLRQGPHKGLAVVLYYFEGLWVNWNKLFPRQSYLSSTFGKFTCAVLSNTGSKKEPTNPTLYGSATWALHTGSPHQ